MVRGQHRGTRIRGKIRGCGRRFARKLQPNDARQFAGLIVLDVLIAARHQPEISRRSPTRVGSDSLGRIRSAPSAKNEFASAANERA